jgi:hypothetical protein
VIPRAFALLESGEEKGISPVNQDRQGRPDPLERCPECKALMNLFGHEPWCKTGRRGPKQNSDAQRSLDFDSITFSKPLSEAAKQEGMELSASSRATLLESVRAALVQIALRRPSREATADDGQEWLIAQGYKPSDLGNAAGSMFTRTDWTFTGRWTRSSRISSHANDIRIWRLK